MGRRGTACGGLDRHHGCCTPRALAARRKCHRTVEIRQHPRQALARAVAMASYNSVAVIGAGAWGTALASVASRAGRDVMLYARNAEAGAHMMATRENPRLPGINLDARIIVSSDIATAAGADIILLATPAQNLREAVAGLAPHLAVATPVIACAKGIERGTHKF